MKQMTNVNLGSILSQEMEAQASELELKQKQKYAAKVISKEKECEFDRDYHTKFCDLDYIFSYQFKN